MAPSDFDRVDHQRAVARRIESALDEMVISGVLDAKDRATVRFDVSGVAAPPSRDVAALRTILADIEALHHGATHEYADGYNNGVKAAARVVLRALSRALAHDTEAGTPLRDEDYRDDAGAWLAREESPNA